MNVSSERSKSLWMDTSVYDDAPTLQSDETADVIVVGSGIAGLSIAYELAKAGKSVIVVDRGPIGKGMTSRTTAHLTAQCDDGFDKLIGRRGEDLAKLWYQSKAASIDRIEVNQKELDIDCDFRRIEGHLFLAQGMDVEFLDKEIEATRKVGMPVNRAKGVPFPVLLPLATAYWIVVPEAMTELPKIATFRSWLLAEAAEDRKLLDAVAMH